MIPVERLRAAHAEAERRVRERERQTGVRVPWRERGRVVAELRGQLARSETWQPAQPAERQVA